MSKASSYYRNRKLGSDGWPIEWKRPLYGPAVLAQEFLEAGIEMLERAGLSTEEARREAMRIVEGYDGRNALRKIRATPPVVQRRERNDQGQT